MTTINLIFGIVGAIVMTFMSALVINYVNGGKMLTREGKPVDEDGIITMKWLKIPRFIGFKKVGYDWLKAIGFGVISAVLIFILGQRFMDQVAWLAIPIGIFFVAAMLTPPLYWRHAMYVNEDFRDEWKPIIPIILIEVPLTFGLISASYFVTSLWGSTRFGAIMTDLVVKLPWMLATFIFFFMLLGAYFIYRAKCEDFEDAPEELAKKGMMDRRIGYAARIVGAVIIALIILFGIILDNVGKDNPSQASSRAVAYAAEGNSAKADNKTGASDSEKVEASNSNATSKTSSKITKSSGDVTSNGGWATFYCLDPKTKLDEFGPDPYKKEWTGKDAWKELKKSSKKDPLIGISAIYYNDSSTGNRYLTEYYNKYDDDTDAINAAIQYYVTKENKADGKEYSRLVSTVFDWIEAHEPNYEVLTSAQLTERGIKVSDQLYANKYSNVFDEDGFQIPAAIVYDCGTGTNEQYLVVTYSIKNRKIIEIWHIGCRFQPCNVSKVMRVKVQERPTTPVNSTPTPTPVNPTPIPTPTPPTPTPTPTPPSPTPKYDKDKTKGIKDPGNDDKGPGSDTNNGKGATKSKADTPYSSSNKTLDEYSQIQEDLKKTNETQKTGGDSNKPSTDGKADNVDNNGAAIDKPTEIQTKDSQISDNDKGEWY